MIVSYVIKLESAFGFTYPQPRSDNEDVIRGLDFHIVTCGQSRQFVPQRYSKRRTVDTRL